jgi:glycosyltransferase involved in cell wall biosynthesis
MTPDHLSSMTTLDYLPRTSGQRQMVSVVMPAYNEEDSVTDAIAQVRSRLESSGLLYEIILVDDGSSDGTRQAAARGQDGSVQVIGYDKNVGKGHALLFGSNTAKGDFLVFMDSDLEVSPSRLSDLIGSLKDADFAIASKRHPRSHVQSPPTRAFLSIGFNILVRLLTGVNVTDTQSGLKAMRTDSFRKVSKLLSVKRYAFDVELLTVASLLGMRITELPVDIKLNVSGFKPSSVLTMLVDVLGITYRLRLTGWYAKKIHAQSAPHRSLMD